MRGYPQNAITTGDRKLRFTFEQSDFMDSAQLLSLAVGALFRRKFTAAFIFVCSIALVLTGIALSPRTYRSEAKLFVRLGRETVTLDPTATTGQTVAVQSSREIEVRSVRDMLASRILLEQVVDSVGSDFVLDPPVELGSSGDAEPLPAAPARPKFIDDTIDQLRFWAAKVRLSDPVPARDKAVRELEEALTVDGGTKSSVITVELESESPTAAQKLLSTYIDAYRQLHVRVNRTPENFQFFAEQTENLHGQLQEAREQLQQAKDAQGIVEIGIRKQNLQEQVSGIDLRIRDARAQLAAAEAQLLASKQRLADIPERLLSDEVKGLGDAATDTMRPQLYQLEIEAERVKKLYAAGHPERERVLAQLESARKIYDGQSKERPTQTSTVNQAYVEISLKVIEEESKRAAVVAELEALQTQRGELQETLRSLNAAEIQIARLQERADLLQSSHRQYAENLELSRIDEELKREEISNVSVVQPPSLILQPVKPNKKLIFAAGCCWAMLNALAVCMFFERRRWQQELGLATAAPVATATPREAMVAEPVPAASSSTSDAESEDEAGTVTPWTGSSPNSERTPLPR